MNANQTQISIKGKQVKVSSVKAEGFEIVITGSWLKTAAVRSEHYSELDPAENPERLVAEFKKQGCGGADLFSFGQRLPDIVPRYNYPMHLDNVAVLPLNGYEVWEKKLSQDTRRNVRLAAKRGVVVKEVQFDDQLVAGIKGVYDETPVRQGRPFWHYGKDFETIKRENGTYQPRSHFLAAYSGTELIGFLKMVNVGSFASIMQILSKTCHYDKRPMNALMAKAVEVANKHGRSHLVYCKYTYHGSYEDALTEFKRRNGFEKVCFPQYYVPLTLKGRLAVKMKLQLGASELLPERLIVGYLRLRNKYYRRKTDRRMRLEQSGSSLQESVAA